LTGNAVAPATSESTRLPQKSRVSSPGAREV
jgi:hypothetical protein